VARVKLAKKGKNAGDIFAELSAPAKRKQQHGGIMKEGKKPPNTGANRGTSQCGVNRKKGG